MNAEKLAIVTMTVNGEIQYHLIVGDGHIESSPKQEILNIRRDAINSAHDAEVKRAVEAERARCRRLAYDVADGKIHPAPSGAVEAFKIGHSVAANAIGDALRTEPEQKTAAAAAIGGDK